MAQTFTIAAAVAASALGVSTQGSLGGESGRAEPPKTTVTSPLSFAPPYPAHDPHEAASYLAACSFRHSCTSNTTLPQALPRAEPRYVEPLTTDWSSSDPSARPSRRFNSSVADLPPITTVSSPTFSSPNLRSDTSISSALVSAVLPSAGRVPSPADSDLLLSARELGGPSYSAYLSPENSAARDTLSHTQVTIVEISHTEYLLRLAELQIHVPQQSSRLITSASFSKVGVTQGYIVGNMGERPVPYSIAIRDRDGSQWNFPQNFAASSLHALGLVAGKSSVGANCHAAVSLLNSYDSNPALTVIDAQDALKRLGRGEELTQLFKAGLVLTEFTGVSIDGGILATGFTERCAEERREAYFLLNVPFEFWQSLYPRNSSGPSGGGSSAPILPRLLTPEPPPRYPNPLIIEGHSPSYPYYRGPSPGTTPSYPAPGSISSIALVGAFLTLRRRREDS